MTNEEEFDLRMELLWYKDTLDNLKPKIIKYARMCTIAIIMSFVYGGVAGALIF